MKRAIAIEGYTLSPDPMPEQNIFVRSDQYSFVKRGIPSVYLEPGFTAADPKVNGREVFETFLNGHYHQPSDDLSLPMDLKAVARFAGRELPHRARDRERPRGADVEEGELLWESLRDEVTGGFMGVWVA